MTREAGRPPQTQTAALDRTLPVRDATRACCRGTPPGRRASAAHAHRPASAWGAGGTVPAVPLARPRSTPRTVPALAVGDSLPRCREPARPSRALARVGWGSPSWRDALPGGGEPHGRGRCFLVFPLAPLVPNVALQ